MKRFVVGLAALMVLTGAVRAVEIETVPVGSLGNTGEWSGESYGGWSPDRICGAVDYAYNIGKYEVTTGQYTEFLNEVAGIDTYGLYRTYMWSRDQGCKIERFDGAGTLSDPYQYRVASERANRPVNYVSWYDAAMFANWLTSGNIHQGAYDTSSRAGWGDGNARDYRGITAHDSDDMDALVSTHGTVYVIPTEDEWYKAAYHKNDGDTGNYFNYPTNTDAVPGYINNSGEFSQTGDGASPMT